jgi:hypothetical protein
MAIDSFSQPPLRHLARFVASGTFSVPEGATRLFVSVNSAQGVNGPGTRGVSARSNGYVNVIPGKTAQVVIGAGSTSSSVLSGTTSFDGAITVTGSTNGTTTRYGSPAPGSAGTITTLTTLPGGAPSGAAARVTNSTSSTQDVGVSQSGSVDIYG